MTRQQATTSALAAIIELRGLMAAEVYVGDQVRALIARLRDALPDDVDQEETADILRAYLEASEMERARGVGPFSVEVADQYLDEIEVTLRRGNVEPSRG